VWQALYEELYDRNFIVLSVALDSGGASTTAPWIRAAKPTYPCLIDERHLVAELYGMVNVPNAGGSTRPGGSCARPKPRAPAIRSASISIARPGR
jgi:alkyl hydroperoxide reductase subunit AhpC